MANQALREQKSKLRKKIATELAKLDANEIKEQSEGVFLEVINMRIYIDAPSICVFLGMPGKEISTHSIVEHAFQNGKKVFIPYIHTLSDSKSKTMDMLELRDDTDLKSLKPDNWGIPSLSPDSVPQRMNALGGKGIGEEKWGNDARSALDIIFMPGVAFDHSYRRLGHGKGFYDRYLEQWQAAVGQHVHKTPYLAGLALKQQFLPPEENVPVDDKDWTMDAIITTQGVY